MPRKKARRTGGVVGESLLRFGVIFFTCAVAVILALLVILPAAASALATLVDVRPQIPPAGEDSSLAVIASVIFAAFLTLLLVSIIWFTRQNSKLFSQH